MSLQLYLVVSAGNVCTNGTHKCCNVINEAVWEALTPWNIQFRGQEQVMSHALGLQKGKEMIN